MLIIKKFCNILYDDFNNFIDDTNIYSKECIEYFKARILYSFSLFNEKSYYQWDDKPLYMIKKLYLSDFLKYKTANGIIFFNNFSMFYKNIHLAFKKINSSHSSDDKLKLTVSFILKNGKRLEDSLGFNIKENDKEESVLYLPFSSFKFNGAKYDLGKMTAEINLEII